MYKFNTIEDAIKEIKEGKIIIVVDNPDRENEGDLLMAAEKVTGEAINLWLNMDVDLFVCQLKKKD